MKTVVPAVTAIIAYPILLSSYGANLAGAWALLSSSTAFIAAADGGLAQHLTRQAAGKAQPNQLSTARRQARHFLLLSGGLLVLLPLALIGYIQPLLAPSYPLLRFALAIGALGIGSVAALVMRLDTGLLSARGRAFASEAIATFAASIAAVISLAGILLGLPLEGLGIGQLVGFTGGAVVAGWNLHRTGLPRSSECRQSPSPLSTLRSAFAAAYDSRWFWTINLGFLLRDPIVRIAIAGAFGLAGVAAWDIGARIARGLRELIAGGTAVLFPAIVREAGLATAEGEGLVPVSSTVLFALGAVAFGGIIGIAPYLLPLWLVSPPDGTLFLLVMHSLWQLMTLLNIAFWYRLLAGGRERLAAGYLWAHTLTVIGALPLALTGGDVQAFGVLWLIGAFATQIGIFVHAERSWGSVRGLFVHSEVRQVFVVSVAWVVLCLLMMDIARRQPLLAGWVTLGVCLAAGLPVLLLVRPCIELVARYRNEAS